MLVERLGLGDSGTQIDSGRKLPPSGYFHWEVPKRRGHHGGLWDAGPEWLMSQILIPPPQELKPSCCPTPACAPFGWLQLVWLLMDPGTGSELGLVSPTVCSPWEQQPHMASGATGTWKDNYHQHAIGDEGLRWRGTERQNENSWSVISFWTDFSQRRQKA